MRHLVPCLLLVLLPVLGMGACGSGGAAGDAGDGGPAYPAGTGTEPSAGSWRTWVVDAALPTFDPGTPPAFDSPTTAAELAELQSYASVRTGTQLNDVATWDQGICRRWNAFAQTLVTSTLLNPPRASRAYMLLSLAMYDATVVAWRAKQRYLRPRPSSHAGAPAPGGVEPATPSFVSERACLSAAAREVLVYVFPGSTASIDALLQSALDADLIAGVAFRSDVNAGHTLGTLVGAAVVADAQTDGADNPNVEVNLPDGTTYVPAAGAGAGTWCRTPPAFANPLLPGWGGVRTRVLASGSSLLLPTPPVWNSPEGLYFRDEVYDVSQNLTPGLIAIAQFWADGGGTSTPPGHWNQIALDQALADGVNEVRTARLLALLNVAQADAFVACWFNKYHHDYPRPITEIRANIDAAWNTVAGLPTPPFPSYPSGHSSTSGAASQVLAFLLPAHAASFASMATEAKNSRLYGGIHYAFDNDAGLDLGRLIGNLVIAIAENDGSP